ncbi:MAG TPA: DNA recombination protein RmuC [Terracidiphilus sp.]|nr:DNA recombination protein RmuC [Terracidiphilus sp.]
MPLWIIATVATVAGLIAGFLLSAISAKSQKSILEQRNRELADAQNTSATQLAQRDGQILDLTRQCSRLESDLANEKANAERLTHQFKVLANEILKENSKTFAEGSQKELENLLKPLRERIQDFQIKVEAAQKDNLVGRTELFAELKQLRGLNEKLSTDAQSLATALRGSAKTQGDWGEFILRDLLEKAGLREGEQYSFQQTFSGLQAESGERLKSARTDVIVYLPGGRHLVIDSKVSLSAYTDYTAAADDAARGACLKLHMASMRGHVSGLAKAGYNRLPALECPDFVVMFVPVEPAFLLALQNDGALWADAYEQGILLVGPTTLLYVIRIVNVLWQQELQSRSVRDVMDRGAELYDKFVGFVSDLEAVGKSIRAADQSYAQAMKKLSEGRGNLVRQVEMLKDLGVRTTKSLPQSLLDAAAVDAVALDEPTLALAAEADEPATTKS